MASQGLADSVMNFSVDLYKQLMCRNELDGNILCSPFGVACALSMAMSGAHNKTAKEIAATLHVKASPDRIRENFAKFIAKLSTYTPNIALHLANRMYSDKRFPPKTIFVSLLESSYGTTIKTADFSKNAEKVRLEVNSWASERTASRIRELLPPGSVDAKTALIVLSAIGFKGFWQWPFMWRETRPQNFLLDSMGFVTVDMMFQDRSYKLGRSEDLKARALEVPYRGQKVSLVILLPDDVYGLSVLEENLSSSRLFALLGSLETVHNVQLSLPKFKIEHGTVLDETLFALGVKDLFTPGSVDLSGIFENECPAVSHVVHKAFVQVDEEGTEAAAKIKMMPPACDAGMPLQATRFVVDHPFMFVIKINEPDLILFMGSVRKPVAP